MDLSNYLRYDELIVSGLFFFAAGYDFRLLFFMLTVDGSVTNCKSV